MVSVCFPNLKKYVLIVVFTLKCCTCIFILTYSLTFKLSYRVALFKTDYQISKQFIVLPSPVQTKINCEITRPWCTYIQANEKHNLFSLGGKEFSLGQMISKEQQHLTAQLKSTEPRRKLK